MLLYHVDHPGSTESTEAGTTAKIRAVMIQIDLTGKRALIMGVTNTRSLGWGIATKLSDAGAQVAFSYQGDRLRSTLEKMTRDMDAPLYQVDVTRPEELRTLFDSLKESWGGLDYIVHSIAYAPREAMEGRYIETSRDDWLLALEVSAYSLVAITQAAEPLLREGASIVTLSFYAAEKVVPKYNVMGIAKSALEASVRYLAYDLGKKGQRINAISAGPVKTVAARSIPGFSQMLQHFCEVAPLGQPVTPEDVGNLGLFLLSPLSGTITGETIYLDSGFNIMGMALDA